MRLDRLIPAILACAALADGVARLSRGWPEPFRAHEALARFAPPLAPYEPERVAVVPASYGDLAAMGNLPALREYREDRVRSDRFGYRNAAGRAPVLLLGDSFALGMGTSDGDTLADQIARAAGVRVYNAGSHKPFSSIDPVFELARRTGARTVVWEVAERAAPPFNVTADPVDPWSISPLRIAAGRWWRRIEDDVWLPNPGRAAVVRGELLDGRAMLFYPGEVDCFHARRTVSAQPWPAIAAALDRRGLRLLIVLAPVKYTVYYPLLRTRRPAAADPNPYHAELTAALVPLDVVDLTRPLRDAAREAFPRGELLYWRDDTHWNARGVKVAAGVIAERLR